MKVASSLLWVLCGMVFVALAHTQSTLAELAIPKKTLDELTSTCSCRHQRTLPACQLLSAVVAQLAPRCRCQSPLLVLYVQLLTTFELGKLRLCDDAVAQRQCLKEAGPHS